MNHTWNFIPTDQPEAIATTLETADLLRSSQGQSKKSVLKALSDYIENHISVKSDRTRLLDQTLNFRAVTERDITTLVDFFDRYPSRSCDFSIGGILMWKDYFRYEMAILDDTLFLRGFDPEKKVQLYYRPIGKTNARLKIDILKTAFKDYNRPGPCILISNEESSFEEYLNDFRDADYTIDNWKEYLYDITQFLGFSGKKMAKKRNHLNYFEKHYCDFKVFEINPENAKSLIPLTEEFENNHDESSLAKYESERTIDVLNNYSNYPFTGIYITINDKIAGYSFGEVIGDTCFVHVEKGLMEYQGIYQALSSRLAQQIKDNYPAVKYLNREEDMGYESLRKSKESYHPTKIMNKISNII